MKTYLLRSGILTAERSARVYTMMVLLGYGIGLTVNYFEVAYILRNDFNVLSFLQAEITYDLGRLPLTIGHLGMLMLFCRSNLFVRLKS